MLFLCDNETLIHVVLSGFDTVSSWGLDLRYGIVEFDSV